MHFRSKVQQALAAKPIMAYRFTENVLPTDIDQKLKGYGDYGRGTYFSLEPFRFLGHEGNYDPEGQEGQGFTIVSTVEITGSVLRLNSDLLKDVNQGLGTDHATVTPEGAAQLGLKPGSKLRVDNLTGWAKRKGYDAITIERGSQDDDTPEGGNQIILVPGSSARVKVLSYDFAMNDRATVQDIAAHLKDGRLKKGRDGGYGIVGIKPSNARRLSQLIAQMRAAA